MPSESHLPHLTAVTELSVKDGVVSWIAAESKGHMNLQEVTLVLQRASHTGDGGFVVFGLIEKADDKENPFEAKFLATETIPPQLQQYLVDKLPTYLRRGNDNEVDVVVSTKSGANHALQFWQTVLQPLWALITDRTAVGAEKTETKLPRTLITESEHSVRTFARELWATQHEQVSGASKSRTVILLSGDGGVVDLLNGSSELESPSSQVLIALLPLGTGNALFHSTHKPLYVDSGPSPLVAGLGSLFTGATADLPVLRASFSDGSRIVTFADNNEKDDGKNDQETHLSRQETAVSHLYGAIVASYGFHASIVYESDTPEYRVHGSKRFGMVAQELLRESHPYEATVSYAAPGTSADFKSVGRDSHAYVLTTLVSNLERTFTISPEGRPLDGQLRLVHFGPVGGERTLDVMMKAYDGGKHVRTKWDDGQEVGYESVEAVKIVARDENNRWRKVCIDGTIVELPYQGHVVITRLPKSPCRIVVDPSVLV